MLLCFDCTKCFNIDLLFVYKNNLTSVCNEAFYYVINIVWSVWGILNGHNHDKQKFGGPTCTRAMTLLIHVAL